MTDELPPPKRKKNHHPDRITLDLMARERIDMWTERIVEQLKGSRFTRSDLVNFLILNRHDELMPVEMKTIVDRFYDPAKALLWAAKKVKEAQKSGEEVNLNELINASLPKRPKAPRKSKGPKLPEEVNQTKTINS